MTMPMRQLQLKTLPTRVIRLGTQALGRMDPYLHLRAALRDEFRGPVSRGEFPTENAWLMLEYVPQIAADFTAQQIESPGFLDELENYPAASFYLLTKRANDSRLFPALVDRLQEAFENDGELVAAYASWIKHCQPPGLTVAAYKKVLFRHPIHAIRWVNEERESAIGPELLAWAHENAHVDAGAAWLVAVSRDAKDADEWRPIIQKSPLYMAASAAAWDLKFRVEDFPDGMDGQALFLLLRNGACENIEQVEALLRETDAFWFAEWVLTSFGVRPFPLDMGTEALKRLEESKHPLLDTLVATWKAMIEQVDAKSDDALNASSGDNATAAPDDDDREGAMTNSARG